MITLTDRRGGGIRARLARLCFAVARKLLGNVTPLYYEYYARKVPETPVVELAVDKVAGGAEIEPASHRDALYRLATEVGSLRREQVITRLALHDAGVLILPPQERARLLSLYSIVED